MEYLEQHYKDSCIKHFFDNYVAEDVAFNLGMKLKQIDKVLSKQDLDNITSPVIITVDYNSSYNLLKADGSADYGTYALDKRGFYELIMYENASPEYSKIELPGIVEFLESIEAYTFEYITGLGIFNIKTASYLRTMIDKYPKQVFESIEIGDETITTCEDHLTQFKIFWMICKSQNYAIFNRARKSSLQRGLIPIARFVGRDTTIVSPIILDCISKTILQEHLKVDKSFPDKRLDGIFDTIYWVSFKTVVEFLNKAKNEAIHPPEILEILLSNFGYVDSNLCTKNEKLYEKYIDQYGLPRFKNLNADVQEQVSNNSILDSIENHPIEELEEISSLESLFS